MNTAEDHHSSKHWSEGPSQRVTTEPA